MSIIASVLPLLAVAPQGNVVVLGDIRVEVLSPTLVRLEAKGPKGFEDRPTFRVPGRNGWNESRVPVVARTRTGTAIIGKGWKITIPNGATALDQATVSAQGHAPFHPNPKIGASVWLPPVGQTPKVWSFADSPRLVPSPAGAVPNNAPNSGWDTGNDAPDIYLFFPGGDYRQLRKDFLRLTGPTEMPPLFMLGYIDSKWYPYTEDEAVQRVDDYRNHDIPLDVVVMDTDWRVNASFGYAPNTKLLPDIKRLFRRMHEKHVRVMFNDHPEPQSDNALDPKEMTYRWDGLGGRLKDGLDVWWYDRNWGVSLKEPMPGLRHEVWGMQVYRDMTLKANPDRRPVIMANVDGIDNGYRNHAPDAAAHRFPVQWTGDTQPTWDYLHRAVDNAVFSGVQGLNPWVNDDLGGHTAMPPTELYIRYMEYGALCPVMRPHCTYRLERAPWHFGPEAERIVRDYTKLRYRLMPLFYASARKSYDTGEPIVRRLDLDYPKFEQARRNDQYLLGSGLLVAPISTDSREVALNGDLLRTPDGKPGVLGEYYSNDQLDGAPTVVKTEPDLNLDWGDGSPAPQIPSDHFSARWTGKIGPIPAGKALKLAVTGDDGVRVWLDGKLVVDQWKAQNNVTSAIDTVLQPGKTYDLKVEYYEITGGALCRLRAYRNDPVPAVRDVWIPPSTWTDVWTGRRVKGPRLVKANADLNKTPMFVRDGTVIPLAPDMNYTGEKPWTPVTLEVYPGGDCKTELYEDDGNSNAYKKGAFRRTAIELRGSSLSIHGAQGTFLGAPASRKYTLRWHTGASLPKSVRLDGKAVQWRSIRAAASFPLSGRGPSVEGNVIEITIPSGQVTKAHTVEVF